MLEGSEVMVLPNSKHREKYLQHVKEFEDELKQVTSDSAQLSDLTLHDLQQKLDVIASKYQDDEKIGTARYKLYELQAYIHYFEHHDEQALDFINHAIELRGSTYQKAEELKELLVNKPVSDEQTDESKMTKAEKRKRLIGLEGWLAWFTVGLFISLILTTFNFFNDGFMSTDMVDTYNEYQAGLGDTIQNLSTVENISLVIVVSLIITTIVLLFRRKKLAKRIAIITLVLMAAYSILDYAAALSVFESAGLTQYAEVSEALDSVERTAARNIFAVIIWVPYFIVSKRVKATLTR